MSKKINKEENHMQYGTYVYLNSHLEQQLEILHKEYCFAIGMLNNAVLVDNVLRHNGFDDKLLSANKKIHDNYVLRRSQIYTMQRQLKQSFKKNCSPNVANADFFS